MSESEGVDLAPALWLWSRATQSLPIVLVGGVLATVAIIVQMSNGHDLTETYAVAIVVSTAGVGFALDDPAAETVAASPTTLGRRRTVRILLTVSITAVSWGMIAMAVATSKRQHFPTYDVFIEVCALAAIGLATSGMVQRRTGGAGGPSAALIVLVGPAFMSGVAFRDVRVFPSLVPGQDLRERWLWLAVMALGLLVHASRDPAATTGWLRLGSHRG